MKKILVLMRNESVYNKLVSKTQVQVEPYIPDFPSLQTWASQFTGQAVALLDTLCPFLSDAETLLERLSVPVTKFEGAFVRAELWLMEHGRHDLDSLSNQESDSHENITTPSLKAPENTAKVIQEQASQDIVDTGTETITELVTEERTITERSSPDSSTFTSEEMQKQREDTRDDNLSQKARSPFRNNPYLASWKRSEPSNTPDTQDAQPALPTKQPELSRPSVAMSQPHVDSSLDVNRESDTTETKGKGFQEEPSTQILPDQKNSEKIIYVEKEVPTTVYIREEVTTTLSPRIVVVINMWPRAGSSFISSNLAALLAQHLTPGKVSLIEHPNQLPRLWESFSLENVDYTDWTTGQPSPPIQFEGVDLIPIHPEHVSRPGREVSSEKLVQYIYRQLRKPFLIVDAGANIDDDILLENADDVLLVMDCDPSLIVPMSTWETFRELKERFGDRFTLVLNKWTRHVAMIEPFSDAVILPYLDPVLVQRAAWDGKFASTLSELTDDFQPLVQKLVFPWIPAEARKTENPQRRGLLNFGRWNKR